MVLYLACLKGTMSEAELFTMRARLQGGLRHKAARGALATKLPVGFVYAPTGQVILDRGGTVFQSAGSHVSHPSDQGAAQWRAVVERAVEWSRATHAAQSTVRGGVCLWPHVLAQKSQWRGVLYEEAARGLACVGA